MLKSILFVAIMVCASVAVGDNSPITGQVVNATDHNLTIWRDNNGRGEHRILLPHTVTAPWEDWDFVTNHTLNTTTLVWYKVGPNTVVYTYDPYPTVITYLLYIVYPVSNTQWTPPQVYGPIPPYVPSVEPQTIIDSFP